MTFKITEKKTLIETNPFSVEELRLEGPKGASAHPWYRLRSRDWVNILPITVTNHALLIKQYRTGSDSLVLEVPGGVIDDGERDPTMAAMRELEEETGFTSQRILPLGTINPNPAIMTNKCHFFVALGCHPNPNRKHFPDAEESIAIELVETHELDHLVRTGRIDHALAALCITLAAKYVKIAP